ncbi:HAD family hydrolase [Actinacidiphila glaucinigra]
MQLFALFDLDGTLVDRQAAYTAAVAALCQAHDFGHDIEQWLLITLEHRATPHDFTRLQATFAVKQPVGSLWRDYVHYMAATAVCRPAVLDGLTQLRIRGWTIGVITNGAADIQRAKLAATGIDKLVDGVAVSGDLEIRKPDRRLFELAAARCGLQLADGGWMIGDNPATDVAGGRQVGMRTIWLRGRPWPDALAAAHHAAGDATEAISLLLNETE